MIFAIGWSCRLAVEDLLLGSSGYSVPVHRNAVHSITAAIRRASATDRALFDPACAWPIWRRPRPCSRASHVAVERHHALSRLGRASCQHHLVATAGHAAASQSSFTRLMQLGARQPEHRTEPILALAEPSRHVDGARSGPRPPRATNTSRGGVIMAPAHAHRPGRSPAGGDADHAELLREASRRTISSGSTCAARSGQVVTLPFGLLQQRHKADKPAASEFVRSWGIADMVPKRRDVRF